MTMLPDREKRSDRQRALGMTALAMVIVFIMWTVLGLEFFLGPLRLFVIYIHEAGHALMTLLTGGRVGEFVVSLQGHGYVMSGGGTQWLILPAGYLGAAFFGSSLFFLTNRFPRLANTLSISVGGGMVLLSVLFATPEPNGLPTALILGVGAGLLLIVVGLKAPRMLTMLFLNVLAVSTALNAVLDLRVLWGSIAAGRDNDAVFFTERVAPLIPPQVVALTWAGIALVMLGIAVYYGAWQPLKQEINATYESLR